MVAGAASFVATLLLWGDQILCFLGSTLITFIGLSLVIAGRRNPPEGEPASSGVGEDGEQGEAQEQNGPPEQYRTTGGFKNPASLEAGDVQDAQDVVQLPISEGFGPPAALRGLDQAHIIGEPPALKIDLLKQVIASLQSNGAQVVVENQNQERAILRITGSDGGVYTGMVYGGRRPAGIPEIRSLQALVNSGASAGGFLFSATLFSPEAYEFAGARKIRLVTADELDEISL